jgi:hypothetical protein
MPVSGKAARDERCAQAERQQHRIDGRRRISLAALRLGADIGGSRKLTLGQAVDAVVFDQVEHVHVAANDVNQLTDADG